MHYNFAYFPIFILQVTQKESMSVRIFVAFKGCAGAPRITQLHCLSPLK